VSSAGPPSFTIEPAGPFSLAASARFIAGWPPAKDLTATDDDGVRLCFALDSFRGHAGVTIRPNAEELSVHATGDGTPEEVKRQTARILSLDHDATGLEQVIRDDEVVARLYRQSDGLRPVLFHSPYEAAAWSVISARINHRQAQDLRTALSGELGAMLDVDGVAMPAFPLPDRLLDLDSFSGLTAEKVRRLHAVAEAALAGRLDADHLRTLETGEALSQLQEIRGIGPFYAGLVLVRAVGVTDVLPPTAEPRLLAAVARAYGLEEPIGAEELERITDGWRPYRTWVAVMVRATAG
jgi:DNA-3-methyladenine glycosylase II